MSANRRDVIASIGLAAAFPTLIGPAFAQSSGRRLVASMIGAPNPPNDTSRLWADAVRLGLNEQGWVDGNNLRFEVRFTAGREELTESYASELLALQPDVFVTGTTENAVAIHSKSDTVPLVFVAVADPIAAGLIDTYPRPGGRATGVAHLEPSVAGVMADLLVAVAPATTRLVYITKPSTDDGGDSSAMRPYAIEAASNHGLEFEEVHVFSLEEVSPAIERVAARPGAGILIPSHNWVHNNASVFAETINRFGLPAVGAAVRLVDAGLLLAVGVEIVEMFRVGGSYAGRILNGAAPSSLPVQRAPFITAVNLKTAAQQELEIPLSLLATADLFVE